MKKKNSVPDGLWEVVEYVEIIWSEYKEVDAWFVSWNADDDVLVIFFVC